jgi:hypothetical protein
MPREPALDFRLSNESLKGMAERSKLKVFRGKVPYLRFAYQPRLFDQFFQISNNILKTPAWAACSNAVNPFTNG